MLYEDYLLLKTAEIGLSIDDDFIDSVIRSAKHLGVLLPKIPDSSVSAYPKKLMHSKLKEAHYDYPGISFVSVQNQQSIDYAGDAKELKTWRFMLHVTLNGKTLLNEVLQPGSEANEILFEMLGDRWQFAIKAIEDHLAGLNVGHVEQGEKQVYFVTHDKRELLVTPLDDTLYTELDRRLMNRAHQEFSLLYYKNASQTKFYNSGVMSLELKGSYPKLHYPVRNFKAKQQTEKYDLVKSNHGRYLVITADAEGFNATGSSIATGTANLTATAGFVDMLWRKDNKFLADWFALGWSSFNVQGYNKKNGSYGMGRGTHDSYNTTAKKAASVNLLPEVKANGRFVVVLKLANEVTLTNEQSLLNGMRFAGGIIRNACMSAFESLEAVNEALAGDFLFVKDASDQIDDEKDKLHALLDKLAVVNFGESVYSEPIKQYTVANIGYQSCEPPRPRIGTRSKEVRHCFVGGINTLAEFVDRLDDGCFWRTEWDRKYFSAVCVSNS